jgi:hypothetical protein
MLVLPIAAFVAPPKRPSSHLQPSSMRKRRH